MGAGRRMAGNEACYKVGRSGWQGRPRTPPAPPPPGAARNKGISRDSALSFPDGGLRAGGSRENHGRGGSTGRDRDHARDSHSPHRRPRRHAPGGGRAAPARTGGSARPPPRDRRQLYRRLLPHRLLPAAALSVHAGQRGRGRGRRGRQGGQGVQAWRSGRLRLDPRLLRRGAQRRGQAPRQAAESDLLRGRRGDDDERPHGAIPVAPDLPGEEGRRHPGSRRRRWRRPDPLPMGQGARRDGNRHRRVAGEGGDRQEMRG